jgi:hypothetical protein
MLKDNHTTGTHSGTRAPMPQVGGVSSNWKPRYSSGKSKVSQTSTAGGKQTGSNPSKTKAMATNTSSGDRGEREPNTIMVEDRQPSQPRSSSRSRTHPASRSGDVPTTADSIERNQLEIARVNTDIAKMEQKLTDIAKQLDRYKSAVGLLDEEHRLLKKVAVLDEKRREAHEQIEERNCRLARSDTDATLSRAARLQRDVQLKDSLNDWVKRSKEKDEKARKLELALKENREKINACLAKHVTIQPRE